MKQFPHYKLAVVLFLILSLGGCVTTDDFDLPPLEEGQQSEMPEAVTQIAAVKGNFNRETNQIYTFQNTGTSMEGYVVSSDAGGNFYKKLVLQDKASQPTAGIQILIDDNSLYESFNFGRKLVVKLDGLSLWYNNGVYQLGKQNRGDVEAIPSSQIDQFITRTNQTAEIEALPLKIEEFNEAYKNLYIRLNNVQFNRNLVREDLRYSFASSENDQFDGERELESCQTGSSVALSTSTYANFKSLLLPNLSGNLTGILSRNFYDDYYIVVLNSPGDLHFTDSRCDPEFLDCAEATQPGHTVIFEEDFTGLTVAGVERRGFTNINVNGGNKRFEISNASGNRFLRISAYNTEERPLEAWLVTPAINLEESSAAVLSFEVKASYDNASILNVYVSQDYTGNPKTATWTLLDAHIPVGPSSQYGASFSTNRINVSCLQGEVYFGFRYLGAAPDKTTTYDLDNIRLTGE